MFDLRSKSSRFVALALAAVTTASALTFIPAVPSQAAAGTVSDGLCAVAVSETAGVTVDSLDGYCYVAFKSTGINYSWTPPSGVTKVNMLAVGGGGGGASRHSGGGGAGGLLNIQDLTINSSALTISVGAGGNGGGSSVGENGTAGSNTVVSGGGISTRTANGGGYGATTAGGSLSASGSSAGSGGGGGNGTGTGSGTSTRSTGTAGQGNGGGWGHYEYPWAGGGGGGSAAAGGDATSSVTGSGGNGSAISWITPTASASLGVGQISSTSVYFAGGGSGGGTYIGHSMTVGAAGLGGGGLGVYNSTANATSGTPNTGGGGGGSGQNGGWGTGGNGGSGVVVVRYLAPQEVLSFNASDINSYDSSAGTAVNDLSAAGTNDGVLTAGATSTTASYNSTTGSWTFPGGANSSGPYINIGSTISSNAFAELGMTFDFEANFGSQADFWERVIEVGDNNGNSVIIERNNQTTTLSLEVWNNGGHMGNCDLVNAIPTTGNTMARWTIAIDGSTCRIWKDGSASTSLNVAFTSKPATGKTWDRNYVAKSNWSGGNSFEGSVKSVRIYAGALTPAQIGAFSYKTVTYSSNGSTASNSTAVTSGSLRVPAAISRSGYSFSGWNTQADGNGTNYLAGASYTPSADVTLYAKWTANTYTVTYNYNGANNNNLTLSSNYTSGGSAINLPSPTKTGFKFSGWYSDAGFATFVSNGGTTYSPSGSTLSFTLYAKWTLADLVLSYNASDINSYDSASGSAVNDLSTSGTYDGTLSAGTAASATLDAETGSLVFPDGTSSTAPKITLPSISTTTFANNGLTLDFEVDWGATATSWETLLDFSVSGQATNNIYIARNGTSDSLTFGLYQGGSEVGTCTWANQMPTNGHVMKRWTLSIDGSFCRLWKDGVAQADIAMNKKPNTGLVWGSNFLGKSNTGSVPSFGGKLRSFRLIAGSYTPDEIGPFTYKTISYDSNAGSSNIVSTRYTSGAVKLPAGPTRTGYTFAGWFNEAGATTSAGAAAATYTPSADKTLYAGWTTNANTVNFNYNGATNGATAASVNVSTGGSTVLPSPTKTGYYFGGWYSESTFATKVGDAGATYTPSGTAQTIGLWARWSTVRPTNLVVNLDATNTTSYPAGATSLTSIWPGSSNISSSPITGITRDTTAGQPTSMFFATSTATKFVNMGSANAAAIDGDMTLETWINCSVLRNTNGTDFSNIATRWFHPTNTDVADFHFAIRYGKLNLFTTSNSDLQGTADLTSSCNGTKWLLVGFSIKQADGSNTLKFYINGKVDATITGVTHGYKPNANLYIGDHRDSMAFQGKIARFRMYSSAVSETDMLSNYLNESPTFNYVNRTVTFNANDGSGSPSTATQTYNQTTTLTANSFTRFGYTFAGWATTSAGVVVYNDAASYGFGTDLSLFAKWTLNPDKTVTFNKNDGSGTTSTQVSNDSTALTSNAFTRSGFVFDGWATSAGGAVVYADGASYAFTANTTLYAKWTALANKTVTFDANNGNGTMAAQVTNVATNLTANTFTKSGYSFSGWNTAANGTGTAYADAANYAFTADTTLYAQWTTLPNKTVTFNNNSGSGSMTSQVTNVSTSLTTNTFTRMGYTFAGWNTAANGSGTSYTDGASYSFAADTTLYAQWTALPNKTVGFNSNGGSGSMSNQVTNVATTLTANTFTRNGFSFSGWNTAANGTGTAYADAASYAFTSNATLYAQWTALPNKTVTFNNNLGSGSMTAQVTNVATNLTANTFTRNGYSFAGWNTSANGSGTAYVDAASYAFTADTTLYAQWTALPNKTVTFDANNGTGTMTAQATNVATNLTTNTLTRSGYNFAGWNTAANGTGTAYADAASYAFTADTTLYAQWTAINYTITYNSPNSTAGSVPTDSANYNIGRPVAILGNSGSLVRIGYTFAGWTVASDGSGTVLVSGNTLTFSSANINLYAKWTANTYTISYNVNGATGAQANTSDSFTTGGTAVTLSAVGTMQKAGHTFNGWATSASGTPIAGTYTTTSNVTLYAQWTINTITVTYDKGTASAANFTFPSAPDAANFGTRVNLSNNVASSVVLNGTYYAFVGWSDGTTTYATGTSYLLQSNVTMTAIWVQAYEVRYSFNGGTAANGSSEVDAECIIVNGSALLCTSGQSITLNAAPTRAGYNFAGWRDQSGADFAAATSRTLSITSYLFYAQWTPIAYTVTYAPAGGSSIPTETSKNIGDRFTLANTISRTGYTFAGWSDGSTIFGAGATYVVATSNIILTAQWTPLVYTVNYDWNGGSGTAVADASYTVGTTGLTLPSVTDQVKDGYTFSGWATSIGGLALSTPFVPTASTTLYAIWGSGSYNITYAPELGTVGNTNLTVANGTAITLETPTRQGFVFDGWYTAQTGGTRVGGAGAQFTPAASRTLHARWTQASIYGIPVGNLSRLGSINASGSANSTYSGSNANSSVSVNVPSGALPNGTAVNIDMISDTTHASGLINGDKTFILSVAVSWLAGDGTVPDTASGKAISVTLNNAGIKAGALIYSIQGTSVVLLGTATQDGTVTFQLTQDPGIYVVATNPTAPQNVSSTVTSSSATISWQAPSSDGGDAITGYTVTLNNGATCTTTGALSCTINSLTAGTTYTYTVTATNSVGTSPTASGNFSIAANQTVVFNSNSGTGTMANQVANDSASLTLNTFSRNGYSFGGWNTAANGSGTSYADGATYVFTAGTTLYAQWTASTYTVTYNYNGATTQNGPSSAGFTSGGSAISLPSPVKTGYTFDGWFTNVALTNLLGAGGFSYSPTSSPTLYAGWTALPNQTVIFDANGGTGTMSNQVTNVATALTNNTFTQTGYTFAGWNTAANGSGTSYADGASFAFTAGATLYAQWTLIPVAPPVVAPPTPQYERPDAPSGVSATASSSGDSITVSWSAPTFNGGAPIVDYRVTSSSGMACVTTATHCTFNGVNKDVSYSFTVTANNGYRVSNSSSASNTILIPSQLINQRALSASGSQSARGAAVKIVVTGGSTNGPVIYDVSNGSATGCSIDGDGWLTATTSGTCLVTVTMLGDFTYKPVSASTTVSFLCKLVAQAPLTVNASGSTSVSLSTIGGSGSGAVSYSVTDGTADCVLAGNTITATKTGTCVVTATKAADDVYEAATSPSITVSVTVAKPVVITPPPVIKVDPVKHVVTVAPTGKPVLVGTPLIKPIIFGPDSAKLDSGDLKQLRAAATLAKSKNMDVLITGFVKSAGQTTLIEKLLASSRARAVATYLRKLGMKVSIAYAGYGAYNKVAPTANDRRVEIRWIAKD